MGHRQVIVSGAVAQCYINGRLLGRITSFALNSVTQYRTARGIDIPHALEKIPTTVDIGFSMTLLRTMADGGAQGAGISVDQNQVSRAKYFTVLIVDRRTDLPLFRSDFCVCTSENWTLDAKSRMVGNVTCEGITWSNEASSL